MRADLEHRLSLIHREEGHPEVAERLDDEATAEQALRLAVMPVKRDALVELRNRGRIDDVILRRVQARLDLEELRLTGAARRRLTGTGCSGVGHGSVPQAPGYMVSSVHSLVVPPAGRQEVVALAPTADDPPAPPRPLVCAARNDMPDPGFLNASRGV